jgi:polyhydroxyalkanoate synthesis regulator phasin
MAPKIPIIPQSSDWKRVLSTGMEYTELGRSQARAIVSDLVAQGHLARDQMSTAVDEVLDMSRRRSEDLRKLVQNEVQRQLGALGLATKADITALERKLGPPARSAPKQAPGKTAPVKKATATKAPAKKAATKKATATKAAGNRAAPKSAPKAG